MAVILYITRCIRQLVTGSWSSNDAKSPFHSGSALAKLIEKSPLAISIAHLRPRREMPQQKQQKHNAPQTDIHAVLLAGYANHAQQQPTEIYEVK